MVINPNEQLPKALQVIGYYSYLEFPVCNESDFLQALWTVVDSLNQHYASILSEPFDLYNWVNHQPQDEVAYFLNETSSNIFNYTKDKLPHRLMLWIGRAGFVLALEQLGTGFNITRVIKGGAFHFYENCRQTVFFDNPKRAKIAYLQYLF